jgi:error-prone DNA polymerase
MERVLNGKPRRAGMPLAEPPVDGGDSPAWSRKRGAYLPPGDTKRQGRSVPYAELHVHSA